ncbi:antiviral reverse transcriptase Drt3b [Burkholderia theae]|uniref:antiviral reverse transcriptase Drt3b n=1 Tax=Burkholderia theae TaxID=3143496 RepID=UPI003AFB0D9C
MRKKIDVDKSDKHRILHTELLPYEVPLFFNNDRLYTFAKSEGKMVVPEIVRIFMTQERYTVPFEYHVRHGVASKRMLGIIHPGTQLRFANFYSDYHQLLLSLCGRSDYTLRAPFRVATHFIERNLATHDNALNDGDVDTDAGNESVSQFASSYFSYGKYSQLHQFIDSTEFLYLESKFSKLMKFDVKKCFASIYTHSIAWAVKGKEHAKANRQFDSFEQDFDRLMHQANYDETNGIVVGPEVSRIFAEIILQRIDLNIASTLKKQGRSSESFAIRRYVDDYFLFANDDKSLQDIFNVAQQELQFYKLYVNEVKTTNVDRPFSTPESAAKSAVQHVLASTLLGWLKELRQSLVAGEVETLLPRSVELQLSAPFRLATRIARDVKIAVKQANVDFAVTTGYALGALTKEIWRLRKHLDIKRLAPQQIDLVTNLLLATVEILVFFLSMDFRVRPAIRATQCMVMLNAMTNRENGLNANITELFARRTNELLLARSIDGPGGVEALNLLATVKVIRGDILLSSNDLLRVIGGAPSTAMDNPYAGFSYFDFVSILFYMEDGADFTDIKLKIEEEIIRRFRDATQLSNQTDLCMLFMDIIGCPWVSDASKLEIIKFAFRKLKNRDPQINEIGHVKSFTSSKLGFVDWHGMLHFERILNRKELKAVYDM